MQTESHAAVLSDAPTKHETHNSNPPRNRSNTDRCLNKPLSPPPLTQNECRQTCVNLHLEATNNTSEKATPPHGNATPTNQPTQKRSRPSENVIECSQTNRFLNKLLSPITPTLGKLAMSDSDGQDSPGLDLIAEMIQGHKESLQEAVTYSIVVWPDTKSTQAIEGWGGERSRNVNAITKAAKAAVTGSGKGPNISSHPHHINIIDKLDGTPSFLCMKINFESKADRSLFCQARLIPPPIHVQIVCISTVTPGHHLLPPSMYTTL